MIKLRSRFVAENVKRLRISLGLSQQMFAERCHLSVQRVKQFETNFEPLRNVVEIMRIAEGCNVRYDTLFEKEDKTTDWVNALFPNHVLKHICSLLIKKYGKMSIISNVLGVYRGIPGKWVRNIAVPSPTVFANIIEVLQLKSYDLENLADEVNETVAQEDNEEQEVPAPAVVEEPDDIKEAKRMLRVMRLQQNIDEYIKQLGDIVVAVERLRDELAELR